MIKQVADRKGEFAIIAVVLLLIVVLAASGLNDLFVRTTVREEIESALQLINYSALQSGIDDIQHIEEDIADRDSLNENLVKNNFRKMTYALLEESDILLDLDIVEMDIEHRAAEDWNLDDGKKRPQILFSTLVRIKILQSENKTEVYDIRSESRLVFK